MLYKVIIECSQEKFATLQSNAHSHRKFSKWWCTSIEKSCETGNGDRVQEWTRTKMYIHIRKGMKLRKFRTNEILHACVQRWAAAAGASAREQENYARTEYLSRQCSCCSCWRVGVCVKLSELASMEFLNGFFSMAWVIANVARSAFEGSWMVRARFVPWNNSERKQTTKLQFFFSLFAYDLVVGWLNKNKNCIN